MSNPSITSDKDYLKIFDDETITISTSGVTDSEITFPQTFADGTSKGETIITHGIGSIPLVRAFWDPAKNNTWYSTYQAVISKNLPNWIQTVVDASTLKIALQANSAQSSIPVFYRLYDLGAKTFSTDTRIDKVFEKISDQGVVAAAVSSFSPNHTILSFRHCQPEAPIFSLQFSEDGSNWYDEGAQIIGPWDTSTGPPGGPYSQFYYTSAFGYVDGTNFYVWLESNYAIDKTIYVRYALDYRK